MEDNIEIIVLFRDVLILKLLFGFAKTIDDRKRSVEIVLLVRHDADNRVRVLKWSDEYFSKEKDSIGEDIQIWTDEDNLLFKEKEGEGGEEVVKSEQ